MFLYAKIATAAWIEHKNKKKKQKRICDYWVSFDCNNKHKCSLSSMGFNDFTTHKLSYLLAIQNWIGELSIFFHTIKWIFVGEMMKFVDLFLTFVEFCVFASCLYPQCNFSQYFYWEMSFQRHNGQSAERVHQTFNAY